jgi:uncharacterized membrane protein YeaQ/YmgE (transglycosylase-associated protein family)
MFVLIGSIAGWLAGLIMGRGMGFIVNALIGIAGAFVGSYLFGLIGFSVGSGLIGIIITATAGAVVLLVIAGLLRKLQLNLKTNDRGRCNFHCRTHIFIVRYAVLVTHYKRSHQWPLQARQQTSAFWLQSGIT